MIRTKICGITRLDDALAACEAGVDALGFNFADEARRRNRYLAPEEARRLVRDLPPFVATIAVCVNSAREQVLEYLSFMDRVQLHGEERPEDFADIDPARIIKAWRLSPGFAAETMLAFPAGAYLVDAWCPDARGGTGVTCDWDAAAAAVAVGRPVILAGGLTPDNVAEAIRRVRPFAVDTAGGVESAPGIKDHEKIRRFIQNAKAALSVPG